MPRPKGSPNVRSKTFGEVLNSKKRNLLHDYLALLEHPDCDIQLQEKIISTCFPYVYPKLTAAQISFDQDGPLTINIVRFADAKSHDSK